MSATLRPLKLHQWLDVLPERASDTHKGDFGTVLVIGGAPGMAGAPLMAALAAQRVGAGKVMIATHPVHAHTLINSYPSLMCAAIHTHNDLQTLLSQATHVVIGPGLGQSDWSRACLSAVLQTRLPMVVDADALNCLAEQPINRKHWVLTPHLGEAARLLKTTVEAIHADRSAALQALQQQYGGVSVLKGARTLVSSQDEAPSWVCIEGNPGMATAGMGDILAGTLAGLAAQGLCLQTATQLGVCLHAQAGDRAASQGQRGLVATDLLPYLRMLVNP